MKDSKITLAAIFAASSLLCFTLSGCQSEAKGNSTDSGTSASVTQSYEEVYLSRIEYYEGIISDLEDKLLEEKEKGYISDAEYTLRIKELESKIAAMGERIELSTDSNQTSPPPASSDIERETVSESDHIYNDHIYNNEGNRPTTEAIASKSGYKYSVTNGSITVTSYLGNEKSVFIPSAIDGIKVTSIGEEAFKGSSAERIVIPDTVTHIDWFAFLSCKNLCEITIPSSVTSISHGAFDLCPESLIIKCEKGSYAEAYAKSWGFITITQ